jgi:predicted ABC-type ATPase/S-adenosylmethionine/arginine decarboxylase-like enzyme
VRPTLIVIAGPNGSGKTSLTQFLQRQGYDFGEYINPDDIAKDLTGTNAERVRRAQALADERRKAAISAGRSFSFETVFSHPSKLDDLEAAHAAGFDVILFFVAVDDPNVNIERVRTRVALGGHDVPEDRIAPRYARTMALLIEMVKRADRSVIFDNTVQSNDPLAFRGRVVAECVGVSSRGGNNKILVRPLSLVPAWTLHYLIEPAKQLGWTIQGALRERNGVACAAVQLLIDLYDAHGLDDVESIESTLRRCVEATGGNLLHIHLHRIDSGGIAGTTVLKEGCIYLRTLPNFRYAAFDVFFGDNVDPDKCVAVLREAFKPRRVAVNELLRGQDIIAT